MKKNSLKQVRVAFPMFSNTEISKAFRHYQKYVEAGMEGDSILDMGKTFATILYPCHETLMDLSGMARYFRDNYYSLRN